MKRTLLLAGLTCLLLGLLACSGDQAPATGGGADEPSVEDESAVPAPTAAPTPTPAPTAGSVNRVIVALQPRSGSELRGSAKIGRLKGEIVMRINVEDGPPGEHAVHLHETGDCSAADASSAGAHWNPSHEDHGRWGSGPHHLGDIGNILIGNDYKGELTFTTDKWSLGSGEANDILGKAIVIHEKADDFTTQPTGAAGSRIGCGVIE